MFFFEIIERERKKEREKEMNEDNSKINMLFHANSCKGYVCV